MPDLVVKSRLLQKTLLEAYVNNVPIADLSEKYGLEDREIIATIRHLLAQEDIFTEIENRKMTIYKLKSLLAKAEQFIDITDLKTAPLLLKEAHALVRSISEIQDKQVAISEEEARKVAYQQATLLVQVVQASYQKARNMLAVEFPQIDLQLVDDAFNDGVKEIAASYSS